MFNINQMVYNLAGDLVGALCEPDLTSERTQELIKALCEKTNLPWPCIFDALQAKLRYN